jgi:hypothetical protein
MGINESALIKSNWTFHNKDKREIRHFRTRTTIRHSHPHRSQVTFLGLDMACTRHHLSLTPLVRVSVELLRLLPSATPSARCSLSLTSSSAAALRLIASPLSVSASARLASVSEKPNSWVSVLSATSTGSVICGTCRGLYRVGDLMDVGEGMTIEEGE